MSFPQCRALLAAILGALLVPPAIAGTNPSGVPNRSITPGAINPAVTQANIDHTICVRGYTRTIRPPVSFTEPLKRRGLVQYGYADTSLRDYEEDHDVPLEVGGAPANPRNLWPEPRYGRWSAHKKDLVENEIHWRVCHHKMTLAQGQAVFLGDWRKGYKEYVLPRRHGYAGGERSAYGAYHAYHAFRHYRHYLHW